MPDRRRRPHQRPWPAASDPRAPTPGAGAAPRSEHQTGPPRRGPDRRSCSSSGVGLEIAERAPEPSHASPTPIVTAPGAVLHAVPARPLLKAITASASPPTTSSTPWRCPTGATPVPSSAVDRGSSSTTGPCASRCRPPSTTSSPSSGPSSRPCTGASSARARPPRFRATRSSTSTPPVTATSGSRGHGGTDLLPLEPRRHRARSASLGASGTTGTTVFTLRLFSVADQN